MLNKSVLLLKQNYEPLNVCNVKKAIILIFLEKAEVIEQLLSAGTKKEISNIIKNLNGD